MSKRNREAESRDEWVPKIVILQNDIGVEPFDTDDQAILRALKGYHFDLSYAETNMFSGPSDREAFRQRREHIRRLIFDRDPNWDGSRVELFDGND